MEQTENVQTKQCKYCRSDIPADAKVCPHCRKRQKGGKGKWIVLGLVVVIVIAAIVGGGKESSSAPQMAQSQETVAAAETQSQPQTEKVQNDFSGDCGISASAEMETDIIGQPTVTASIMNTTDKDISAIKFYCVPMNVYGEELKGVFSVNELSTDDTIAAGMSDSRVWQLLDTDVKTVKLFVYSVYFSDGTEWGDRNATKTTILKNAPEIEVTGVSGS